MIQTLSGFFVFLTLKSGFIFETHARGRGLLLFTIVLCDMKFLSLRSFFFSAISICILFIWYYIVTLPESVDLDSILISSKNGTFLRLKQRFL